MSGTPEHNETQPEVASVTPVQTSQSEVETKPTTATQEVPVSTQINPPDPFANLGNLALSQDFAATIGIKKILTKVPIQKPNKEWWVMTQRDEACWFPTMVIELKDTNETYLVTPEIRPHLIEETTLVPRMLVVAVARPHNMVFIWPIGLPDLDGKLNPWHASAMDAASRAKERWVRVQANKQGSGYNVSTTDADLPPPKWPEESMADLLRIAFKGRVIDRLDHPVLRGLRGEL